MSIEKSIGWTDLTCNPIKGKCKLGCWYCYYSGKRGIANRFKVDSKVTLNLQAFNKLPKTPKKVFLCSTHEIFGDWIPRAWRDEIFWKIEKKFPQHTFQILTKLPQNIDREMPSNVHLGVSVTGFDDLWRFYRIWDVVKYVKVRFVSFEPLWKGGFSLNGMPLMNWYIVGRLTGHGHKYDPHISQIEHIIKVAKKANRPVFLKDNLIPIVGQKLVSQYQEFPE